MVVAGFDVPNWLRLARHRRNRGGLLAWLEIGREYVRTLLDSTSRLKEVQTIPRIRYTASLPAGIFRAVVILPLLT
jgi:hypothetical protein